MKNPTMVRNFIIFSLILVSAVVCLGYFTFQSTKQLRLTDSWINHTQKVIVETQDLVSEVLLMLSMQRGYLLSGDQEFLETYQQSKAEMSQQIAEVQGLIKDNPVQVGRLSELQHHSLQFSTALDRAMKEYGEITPVMPETDRLLLKGLRENIMRIADDVLNEEYTLLEKRAMQMDMIMMRYKLTLLIGSVVAALIVLIFNWYLLQAQGRISDAEATLRDSEERFRLAIRGSNDGIFDWDFKTHSIYWSAQFKAMLGYTNDEITGNEETFRKMLHPEDGEIFWESFNNYINGELSEFSAIYRMVHKSGRPVWIHGRGKAIFNEEGRAVRFIGAHTDISYIKEHEKQLKEERDRAEAASAAKGEFLAHMSHEIRTPLTAISGIAEIFSQNESFADAKQERLVRTLRTSTESLKELITDILDFSKIESGELDLDNRHFKLGDLFQQVISIMSVRAAEKNLDFIVDYDSVRDTSFYGDHARLRQVFINLVGNAVKFTEEGSVTVNAYIESVSGSNILRVDIVDTGIGISEKSMETIFEKFKQADSSVSRRYGGTGLGLPISKNLAEIMNGTIRVNSVVGKGSTFSVILPFQNSVSEPDVNMEDVIMVQKLNDRLKAAIDNEKRILLVEDYEGNIVVLSYILNSLECAFDVAKTGLEALQLWKEKHYDLILMDVQMPEMDGLTATRTIRNMEDERGMNRTPIIGLTAHALVADRQKCIDAGMDDYLSKPIVEADLKQAILKMLDKARKAA